MHVTASSTLASSGTGTSPTLGHPSFPIEPLPTILIHLHPNDLPKLAATNRHLRRALPTVLNHAFATRHLTVIGCHPVNPNEFGIHRISPHQERYLRGIRFNHPVLFMHAVAAVSMYSLSMYTCFRVWGSGWRLPEAQAQAKRGGKELKALRLKAVRTVIQNGYLPSQLTDTDLVDAFKVAAAMRSLDVFYDLCSRFPDAVAEGLHSYLMQVFLWSCATYGFAEGLNLIPHNHPILAMRSEDHRTLLEEACFFSQPAAVKVLLDLGAAVNPSGGMAGQNYRPPLWCAIYGCPDPEFETLKLLLTHGARMTPVLDAVCSKRRDLLHVLLAFGEDSGAACGAAERVHGGGGGGARCGAGLDATV
ncbi:hypothetical protein HDU96_010770 [Phlyctochytrium bullatum]|nr:hypothetical protein HDU96_010770 [Phlyctochytrium bullatum]